MRGGKWSCLISVDFKKLRTKKKKPTAHAFGTCLAPDVEKTSDALGPGWYNFHKLNLGRKVTYPQTFGGAPVVEHPKIKNECEFVKSLSMANMKKMNAKADYLRLYEPDF